MNTIDGRKRPLPPRSPSPPARGMERAMLNLVVAMIAFVFAISAALAADDMATLKKAQKIFGSLPKDMSTPDYPVTPERIELGRMLFFDPRLSIDANVSCATCHQPALYGSDALPKSIGVRQRLHPRNAPTVLNAAINFVSHWRGDRE